jgi:membrane-bound ClpP family serine protease
VLTRPVNVHGFRPDSVVVDSAPRSTQTWQEGFRDPALTVLLILDLCTIFLAVPLAAKGLPTAKVVADALVLAVVAIVVMLSLRWNAIILILLGLAAIVASLVISAEASPISVIMLRRGGDILTFSVLTWVVADAVYAPAGSRFVGFKAPSCSI